MTQISVRFSSERREGEGRWDPEDLTRVFAHFRGQWIVCRLTKRLHVPMSRCRQAKSDQLRYEASLNNRARVEANEQIANFVDDSIEAAKVERKAADLPQSISTDSKTSKGSFWSVDIPESRND